MYKKRISGHHTQARQQCCLVCYVGYATLPNESHLPPADTPGAVLDAVADVVQASSAFSTIDTVEAAKEEVQHKLQQEQQPQAQRQQPYPATGPITTAAVPAAAPPQQQPQQGPSHKHGVADKVAAGMIAGSSVLASYIARAAASASGAICGYADKRTQAVPPAAVPTKVSPSAKSG